MSVGISFMDERKSGVENYTDLLETNVPQVTNGEEKVEREEYSNINSRCKVKFSVLGSCD